MWTELPEDADVSGGLRSEDGGLPAQPAVVKEFGRFAYLEGKQVKQHEKQVESVGLRKFNMLNFYGDFLQKVISLVCFSFLKSDPYFNGSYLVK